jgi:hypothetical protein
VKRKLLFGQEKKPTRHSLPSLESFQAYDNQQPASAGLLCVVLSICNDRTALVVYGLASLGFCCSFALLRLFNVSFNIKLV